MSFAEVLDWAAYIRKRGSLNIGRRIECSIALLAYQFNRVHGGKSQYSDYTPHEKESEDSLKDIMRLFKAVPNTKRKRHKPKGKK